MFSSSSPSTEQFLAIFNDEVAARGGRITDTFHDGQRLFTRSVLPHVEAVRAGDRLQGGLALKATEERVCLYPYFFRLVCRNGAIVAETIEARSIDDLQQLDPVTVYQSLRESIGACCAVEVFQNIVRKVSTSLTVQADLALNMMPLLSRLSAGTHHEIMTQIMSQFFREGDQTLFGLANAFTAVARDTQDPELRWDLEEMGGGIAVGVKPRQPQDSGRVRRSRREDAVLVS